MNRDLFWRYLETEHPEMEAFCRKLAGNRDDGDDLYQDALLTAMSRLETLVKPESFKPWLYRIIVNRYKSKRRREWLRSRLRLEKYPADNAAISRDESGRVTARIWLEKAFRAVSAEDRALITLFELEGWSVAELAAMYGKPEGTIKSRLSRARKKMRGELKKYLSEKKFTKVEADYALPRCETSAE
jgi:RNA polymerase sigma-70 factor (ECF subfamily)